MPTIRTTNMDKDMVKQLKLLSDQLAALFVDPTLEQGSAVWTTKMHVILDRISEFWDGVR
jgi:hypothetical protein